MNRYYKMDKYIGVIPAWFKQLKRIHASQNLTMSEAWSVLKFYEELYSGLKAARENDLDVDKLNAQIQELAYLVLIQAATALLEKLRKSYDESSGKFKSDGEIINETIFNDIVYYLPDFFKNILVSGHTIPSDLEEEYVNFIRMIGWDDFAEKKINLAKEKAQQILGQK